MRTVREAVSLPLVGIGGITEEVAPQVFAAGADGVAVVRALMGAVDTRATARALWHAAGPGRHGSR